MSEPLLIEVKIRFMLLLHAITLDLEEDQWARAVEESRKDTWVSVLHVFSRYLEFYPSEG
jgi:hypothetical protein